MAHCPAIFAHLEAGAFARRSDCETNGEDERPLEGILDIVRDGVTVAKIVLALENEKDPEKVALHLFYGPTEPLGFTAVEERHFYGPVAIGLLELFGRALLARGAVAPPLGYSAGDGCGSSSHGVHQNIHFSIR